MHVHENVYTYIHTYIFVYTYICMCIIIAFGRSILETRPIHAQEPSEPCECLKSLDLLRKEPNFDGLVSDAKILLRKVFRKFREPTN